MNILTISFIFIVFIALLSLSMAILYRVFGSGIFLGIEDFLCVTVIDNSDNVSEKMAAITENLTSECIYSGTKVLIIDGGMDRGQKELCSKYCEMHNFIIMCTPDEINNVIFSLKKVKRVEKKVI